MESTMDTRNDTIKCNKVHYAFMILSARLGKCNRLSTDCDRTYSTRPPTSNENRRLPFVCTSCSIPFTVKLIITNRETYYDQYEKERRQAEIYKN